MDGINVIREVLRSRTIDLDVRDDDTGIFDHIDLFVNLSREKNRVREVSLWIPCITYPSEDTSSRTGRYAIWEKIAEGLGNLQILSKITITDVRGDDEEYLDPDWTILACILRRLRRGIHLSLQHNVQLWDTDALPAFAGAIHGQAMITGFSTPEGLSLNQLNHLCSSLPTLPALEFILFRSISYENEQVRHNRDEEEGQTLESLVELLQSHTLKTVSFKSVVFTNALSQTVAKALRER
jgi:hypothetical protein